MSGDEAGALGRQKAPRNELTDSKIAEDGRRLLKFTSCRMLVEMTNQLRIGFRGISTLLAIMLAIVLQSGAADAQQSIIVVAPDDQARIPGSGVLTLRQALARAAPGTIIQLRAGIYDQTRG